MPYGPGKFEQEPASTFLIYRASMDGADDDAGNHALFRGPMVPEYRAIEEARQVGYTEPEIMSSVIDLRDMAGAIMYEDEQGFVYSTIYHTSEGLEIDWNKIQIAYGEEAEGTA